MTPGSDAATVSSEALCVIAGLNPSTRRDWVKRERLSQRPRGQSTEWDLVELVALRAVMEALGPTDGPICWLQIRPELGVDDLSNSRQLVAVYDRQDKEAALVTSMRQLCERLPYGHDIAVIDVADPLRRARRALQRLLEDS